MLLLNGKVCHHSEIKTSSIRIEHHTIQEISPNLTPYKNEVVINCHNRHILPALIDLGVCPKNKVLSRKNLESLSQKCLKGGVGSILLTSDLDPLPNKENVLEYIELLNHSIPISLFCSIYAFNEKHNITDIASLRNFDAKAINLKSQELQGQNLMIILHYAKMLNLPLMVTPYDNELASGVIDSGLLATQLGLPSIPVIAWSKEIVKMCEISKEFNCPMLLNITQPQIFESIDFFNTKGAQVIIQTPIHHLILNETEYENYNTKAKMFPPLKHKESQELLLQNLQDGKIQCLSSLQNATYNSQKDEVFELASNGVDIISHYFSILYTFLVKTNKITLQRLLTFTSYNQAKFLNLNKGILEVGRDADIMIVDLEASRICEDFYSPYYQKRLYANVEKMILQGQVYECI